MKCPLCSGYLEIRQSSVGSEIFCISCRNLLKSASFKFDFLKVAANIEQCSVDGLPGWKGPGEEAKCYTYEPGNEEQEKRAIEKANQSAYMEEKNAHVNRMVTAVTDFSTADAPTSALGLGTTEDDDGVTVQTLSDQNKFSFAPRNELWEMDLEPLGRAYCTNCGGDHPFGEPCHD